MMWILGLYYYQETFYYCDYKVRVTGLKGRVIYELFDLVAYDWFTPFADLILRWKKVGQSYSNGSYEYLLSEDAIQGNVERICRKEKKTIFA